MTLDFQGKNVWVTGAGKGIGYTTALAFAAAGANVTGFDLVFPLADYPFACETLDVAAFASGCSAMTRALMCW
ncbi:2,3-dihydro-2,3-dihydroxybenzoate dehydrogenase [enterobactin] siderophore [Cronobacter sakazakii 701]|nr:2,3-dihydro-2,3-dihydroxybenzoate dehydrogenase [enterobactin] siderophore [Cronobacter sakazakii 701]